MSNQCNVDRSNIPSDVRYRFKIPVMTSIETVESFLREATKRIGQDVGLWEKLSDVNWGNNELEYRLVGGKCRPTLQSLLKAKYLDVPSGWPTENLVSRLDGVSDTLRQTGLQESGPRLGRNDLYEDLSMGPSRDQFNSPTVKDEETSPLVWVAGLGAAGLLAYFLLKKG